MNLDTHGAPSSASTATDPGLSEVRESARKIVEIPVDRIRLSPTDPRTGEDVDISDLDIGEDRDGKPEPVRTALWVRTRSATVMDEEYFEIIDGGRRWRKSCVVGLTHVPCEIRDDLSDVEVRRLQLVQNGQRQNLSPMQQARAYGALREEYSWDAAEIAVQLHVSERAVRQGLALLTLCPEAQEEIRRPGTMLTLGAALELVSVSDPKAQAEALKELLARGKGDGELTIGQARWIIRDRFHLRLVDAGFALDDATLVPKAGACLACPKKSDAQMKLLDLGERERERDGEKCTDRSCFDSKRKAALERLKAEAKKTGTVIVTGAEAKKLYPYSGDHYAGKDKVVDLDRPCPLDSKGRSWNELLGDKAPPPAKVVIDEYQRAHRLIGEKEARAALKEAKPKLLERDKEKREAAQEKAKPSPAEEKAKLLRQADDQAGDLILREIRVKAAKKKADASFWRFLAGLVLNHGWRDLEDVAARLELKLEPSKKGAIHKNAEVQKAAIVGWIGKADEGTLRGFIVELLCEGDAGRLFWLDQKDAGDRSLAIAGRYLGVDPKAIRDKVAGEIKAKAAEAKKSKAPASAKKGAAKPAAAPKGKSSKAESPKAGKAEKKSSKAPRAEEQPERDQAEENGPACRVCRCTEDNACEGGCSWTSHTAQPGEELCSSCAGIMQMIAESASDDADGVTREELEDAREEIFESEDEDEANAPSAKVWAAAIADMLKTGELRTLPSGLLATREKASAVEPAAVRCRAHMLAACEAAPKPAKWLEGDARKAGFELIDIKAVWAELKESGAVVMRGDRWQKAPSYEPAGEEPGLRGQRFSSTGIGSLDPAVAQGFRDGLDARILAVTAEVCMTPEQISRQLDGLPLGIIEAALERLKVEARICWNGNVWGSKLARVHPAPSVAHRPSPRTVACPTCDEPIGSSCRGAGGRELPPHGPRVVLARRQLPLAPALALGARVVVTAEGAHKGRPGMLVWKGKGKDAGKISVDLDKRGREKTMPHLSLDVADVKRVEPEPEEAPVAIKPAEIPESREHIITYLAELAEAEKKRTLRGRGAQEKARLVVTELDSIATAIRGGVHAPIAGNEVDAAATYLRASARVVEEPLKTRLNSAAKAIEHGVHLKGTGGEAA